MAFLIGFLAGVAVTVLAVWIIILRVMKGLTDDQEL